MSQQLAHYQIKDTLGEGSFAWVYRAYDPKFEQDVALKVLKPIWMGDQQAVARFKQEARTTRKLRHPHIVDVYDVGEGEGQVYLTQLLVEGETLADRLARGPMAWDEVIKIVTDIASALDYAHSEGIIHRDIKPANILLGSDNKAFLGDFGLVRAVEGSASLSASGSMVGTGHYMAPEVWDGKKATPVTDVYALSCVVFEMLKGEVLFEGSSMMAVLKKHADGPNLPEAWPTGIPANVNDVLERGLAEDPADRISSAGELIGQLAVLSTPVKPALPPSVAASIAPVTSQSPKSGPPWLLIGGAIVIIVLIGVIAFFALSGGDEVAVAPTTTTAPTEAPVVEFTEEVSPEVDTEATIAAAVAATERAKGGTQSEADTEAIIAAAIEATATEQSQQATLEALASAETAETQATDTPIPPTGTPIPEPTATTELPTDTPIPAEDTPTPEPTEPPAAAASEKIAFISNRDGNWEVFVMNANGSEQTNLTNSPSSEEGYRYGHSVLWSPDGRQIAFESDRDGDNSIYIMNADGSGVTRIGNGVSPAWSPDGSRFAIESNNELGIINADGSGGWVKLGDGRGPSWSPDGQRIVFWAFSEGIYVVNSDGSGLTQLTNTGERIPAWSPDGQHIVFVGGPTNNEIYVMNADGSNVTYLTNGFHAIWSPDSMRIAFDTKRDGNWEIYIINADGSNPVNITNHPADDQNPSWGP